MPVQYPERFGTFKLCLTLVRSVKIEIVEAGDDTVYDQERYHKSSRLASCAELSFITDMPEVKITTKTAAEFVGHIDDIGSKYDMIYIGDQKNNDPNTDTDLLTGSNDLCYAHVGAVRGPASSSNENLLKLLQLTAYLAGYIIS